jgi:orotidine-5'-phosphate decarboxylase
MATKTTFYEKLRKRWQLSHSLVCVGLDPDFEKLPPHIKAEKYPLFTFNKAIIDATHDLVCCYKPQIAYYAARGAEHELEMTFKYLQETYPTIPHILDAKRGDIGSTAEMYAKEVFDRYGADAVTVNPFLGSDALQPFLQRQDKGVVILCKTSNPGSGELQALWVEEHMLYERIAHYAQHDWNTHKNILLVVAATFPQEMANIREIAPDIPFLVPGVGAQGGRPEDVVRAGIMPDGNGLIINSSRGIIYAGSGHDFAEAARKQAMSLKEEIDSYRG